MARVICRVPSATSPVNGFEFAEADGALVSVEMTEEEADALAAVPGYEKVSPPAPETAQPPAKRVRAAERSEPSA